MILEETYTLSNGVEIPRLGLGTWFISNDDVVQAVQDAVRIGYRHVDTAQAYRNEQGVGEGIRSSGVSRDELFVTTKLAAEAKSYEEAIAAIDKSLETMGLDRIDMMIVHSPQPWTKYGGADRYLKGNREAWRALEDSYRAGKLRTIGLSNFNRADIDNILDSCSVEPMVNQVLARIGNTPTDLIRYAQDRGILVEAHSPIAHGELIRTGTSPRSPRDMAFRCHDCRSGTTSSWVFSRSPRPRIRPTCKRTQTWTSQSRMRTWRSSWT